MSLHAHVTLVNVLARNGTQVFVTGVLVQPITDLRPADLVVKITYLFFGVFVHSILFVHGYRGSDGMIPYKYEKNRVSRVVGVLISGFVKRLCHNHKYEADEACVGEAVSREAFGIHVCYHIRINHTRSSRSLTTVSNCTLENVRYAISWRVYVEAEGVCNACDP